MTHSFVLTGCRPAPLALYLKALGILRIIAEQKDPKVRGCWRRDRFELHSVVDENDLLRFFLDEYRPTPIVGPWNGGSGFFAKDNQTAISALAGAAATRLAPYRETIDRAHDVLRDLAIHEKPDKEAKPAVLERCRGTLPDAALPWLDATFMLSNDGAKYPPLLGTGGNDGRLDFTNHFMQHVLTVMDPSSGTASPSSHGLLSSALFGTLATEPMASAPVGQFLPSQAGGANAAAGYDGDARVNPWDFVLMLEGAVVFAGAAVRRLEQEFSGALSYPFTVRSTGVGYASAAHEDEKNSRAEMWLPLWSTPASGPEVRSLFSEGRARLGRRNARNGVDFARAVAGLGVDRGIDAFQRYGFQVRNGLSYFAVPIGRFEVRTEPRVALLDEVDGWLDTFRRKAQGPSAPASAARAARQLDAAILELCVHGDNSRLQGVLVALGRCEQAMATSSRWTTENFLQPVPALSPAWLQGSDDGSVEFRLAVSLASIQDGSSPDGRTTLPLRKHLEPVGLRRSSRGLRVQWDTQAGSNVVWAHGHLHDALNAVLRRRLILAVQAGSPSYADRALSSASPGDVSAFIENRVDDDRIAALLWGTMLIDWSRVAPEDSPVAGPRTPLPDALFALLKLCFSSVGHDKDVPIAPRIHRLAAFGSASEASREAIRRLRGCGFVPALKSVAAPPRVSRRTAAALLFPMRASDLRALRSSISRPSTRSEESDANDQMHPNDATEPISSNGALQ